MSIRKLHSLEIHVEGGSQVILPDLVSDSLAIQQNLDKTITAAAQSPDHISILGRDYRQTLETMALELALDTIGVSGLCITSGTNPGARLYLQKFDDCGQPASGSVHRTYQFLSGLIVPRTLTVENQQNARLTFDVVILNKDGSESVVIADNAALPTITETPKRWTLGPITIGGVALSDYQRLEIDFGNEVTAIATQSDQEPSVIEQKTFAPMIRITGIDQEWFKSAGVPISGLELTHANTSIFLRKRTADGTGFVANGTAEHFKATMAGVAVVEQAAQGQSQAPQETVVALHGKLDASANSPLIVTFEAIA